MTQPETDEIDWDDYEATDHDRVWVRKSAVGRLKNSISKEAAKIADAFEDEIAAVVVNAGPYRFYDVRYAWEDADESILSLDYYSVRPGTDRTEEIITDIEASLEE